MATVEREEGWEVARLAVAKAQEVSVTVVEALMVAK